MAEGPDGASPTPTLGRGAAGTLVPVFFVLSLLYALYPFLALGNLSASAPQALLPWWIASSILFAGAALTLRRHPIHPRWAHPILGVGAALVLLNTFLLIHHGGLIFSTILILVLVGFGSLALSPLWVIWLCIATLGIWYAAFAPAPSDPNAALGPLLISSAAVALLLQGLRYDAHRRIAELEQQAHRRARTERDRLAERVRAELVNLTAHELATPLTPIFLHLHHLRSGALEPDQRRSLAVLEQNLQRLSLVIRNLTETARGDQPILLHKANIEFAALLEDGIATYRLTAERRGLRLESEIEPPLLLVADGAKLEQAAAQLLDNAIRFTPPGGRVTLTARIQDDQLRLQVCDTGIGIRPEDQARLFQPFTRLHDPMQHTVTGSGLGLFVARRIVEAHGGTLTVASEGLGRGACFTATIPTDL